MSYTIGLSTDRKMVTFNLAGSFDMSQGLALWQYIQPEVNHYKIYIFDLKEIEEIRDSGLGLLMAFLKRADRDGAEVRILNANNKILQRCNDVGIELKERKPLRYCIANLH